ncbi:GNAT family N-acetyltransferase [Floridanema aerugineum]|uniref:GNAT family N-acetyltransferase n=1 Tax=Floridaenema aerugineum BLCC-F46 TaxID=3153654 RepID=A0ABV4X6V7_9CYAN
MTPFPPQEPKIAIRPLQRRDLEAIGAIVLRIAVGNADANTNEKILIQSPEVNHLDKVNETQQHLEKLNQRYGLWKILSLFPNPFRYELCAYVAQEEQQVRGMIQVKPFNRTRSTWRVERVIVDRRTRSQAVGSLLLRHCFETIWEARTWLLEVNINDKNTLALYRQNGFQPLAQLTAWEISPSLLAELQEREPDLPNLLPVSNADAQLLYQLDTAAMPPLVRQVFDRHVQDFKTGFFSALIDGMRQWFSQTEVVSGYVFEPQRKAAIGYFQIQLSRTGKEPHKAELTVHPAYTWLYPELLSQMARIAQDFPAQSLQLTSADYQPEREEFLEQIGAQRIAHTLLMSRSVWHKIRESKFALEGLQLSEMLQGLQRSRQPVPGRMSWLKSPRQLATPESTPSHTSAGEMATNYDSPEGDSGSRGAEGQRSRGAEEQGK